MKILEEFKRFAVRGNVIDMAIGVIIGAAFGKIVNSLVADVLMPPLGLVLGRMDFKNLAFILQESRQGAQEVAIRYGVFISEILNFVIVAFAMFVLLRAFNALKNRDQEIAPAPTEKKCPECLLNIPLQARRCAHCTAPVA